MKNSQRDQESARQAWTWLSEWVKRSDRDLYKARYTTAKLAQRLECTPGAVSSWKLGRMNFDTEKYEVVVGILNEWRESLPAEGWVTPFHYSDEHNVQHILDYENSLAGHEFVECDRECPCGKRAPSAGAYCMYCGREFPREIE